jgi:hypothetical protein
MNPHPGVERLVPIQVGYQMKDGMLMLEMLAPLVGYALRRWAVNCTLRLELDPKTHPLSLSNLQTLHGVESADLARGYGSLEASP